MLEVEFEKLSSSIVNDHTNCVLKQKELENELDRIKKGFSYVVEKFSNGNDKFENLLSLQRYSLSKHGLGCDPY